MKSFHEFLEEKNLNEDLFSGLKGAWQGFKQGWQGNQVKQQRNIITTGGTGGGLENLIVDFLHDTKELLDNSRLPSIVKKGLIDLQKQYHQNTNKFIDKMYDYYNSPRVPVNSPDYLPINKTR